MRLNGRRQSTNFEKRGGFGGGKIAGIGGVTGIIITAVILWLSGGNPLDALQGMDISSLQGQQTSLTPEKEEAYTVFARQILAGTEDVWTEEFRKNGLTYRPPKLVVYTGAVQSGCGQGTASMGPFYCSADETIYLDLSFFEEMENSMKAGGDFAYAYVIAHEVGHHVQHLLGTLDNAHSQMARMSDRDANQMSVRIELQADYLAGVWAKHDNEMYNSLEPGDIEEGLNAASKIGDDYLQKQAQGYAVPETFNHGRSDQRVRWLKKGVTSGVLDPNNTFNISYSSL